jgi:hypothetical protein
LGKAEEAMAILTEEQRVHITGRSGTKGTIEEEAVAVAKVVDGEEEGGVPQ